MSIDDLRLRTKVLIPLALMAAGVLAVAAFGTIRLIGVSSTASDIIERRDLAAVELNQAAQRMAALPHAVFGIILYSKEDPGRAAFAKEFENLTPETIALLDKAAQLLPDKTAEIGKFKERFSKLVEDAKEPYEAAGKTPGLTLGVGIQQLDLIMIGQSASLATANDADMRELITDMRAFDDALLSQNAEASRALNRQSSAAITSMVGAGVLATLLAGAFALWMTTAKITRPLARMVERMKALATGTLSVEIEGLGRRDELGEIAAAVEVFKTNAIQRLQMEKEAAAQRSAADAERANAETEKARVAAIQAADRSAAEAERAKVEAEKARAADIQSHAMRALGLGLQRLADGDLTSRLDQNFPLEFAKIRDDFNAATEKLMQTVRAVADSAGTIHSGAREISSSSDDLSKRTEQQASSLEETAAALDEITATLKKSAEGAKHASQVAASADEDAKKGAVVVKQTVEAMDAIAESSEQIGRIIGVIDEIAFQTNLLALNAGVEAARAGDAGRGFAVVASEVRALAQRSAEAAKEIKGLVSTSSSQVGSGVRLVAESGKTLGRILEQVSEINRIVAEIATGAQEQASGLQQVNSAFNQIDQSTQQIATMGEESNTASHTLSMATTELANLIEQFQLGGASGDGALRRELQKVAPHAFAKPATVPSSPNLRKPAPPAPAAKLAAKVAQPARRAKVANVEAAADDGWDEF
jgi:methyl-accepting chemotaxis protein